MKTVSCRAITTSSNKLSPRSFGGTVFLNILFGLIFLNAARGQDSNIVDFNNHYGALVLITIR